MDKDEIRNNLSGYRPEIYRDDDPRIAPSLQAAKADPVLSQWLEQELAFDEEVSASLRRAQPPASAKEDLLRAYRSESKWKKRRLHLPLTAAAAILVSSAWVAHYFLMPPPVEFASNPAPTEQTFREQMAFFASQRFVLDEGFSTNTESVAWLAERNYPTLKTIPPKLFRFRGMGCKKIMWQGHRVSLICFKNNSNEIVHLFVLARPALEGSPDASSNLEQLLVFHERETKGWQDDDQVYLLVGSKPGVNIPNLL
ncbi:hypothetical protein [Roseibacillus persicicus]|uniref:hypothetical protein n=1 Tax=Roseibacillus persicicus TaxID=454148 RepID=UPI00280F8397|nr:hypothetical protein [Roseibacillus persicicus]MDQ8192146.1 hypothetical protein [Roseibacillus persicicus]